MRPRPRGVNRLITSALPTCASATTRSSTSRSWLFSALAIADSRHLRTSRAMRLRENSRSASADRSEEHTSELQSPDHLVCRLLLEKKKKTLYSQPTIHKH